LHGPFLVTHCVTKIKISFSIIFRLNFGLRNKQYINWTCFLAIKPRIKIGFRPLSAIHFVKYINLNSRMWFYSSHGTKIHKKQKAKLIMFSILMFIVRIHEKYIVIEAIMIIIIRILILYSDADDLWLGFRLHKARSQDCKFSLTSFNCSCVQRKKLTIFPCGQSALFQRWSCQLLVTRNIRSCACTIHNFEFSLLYPILSCCCSYMGTFSIITRFYEVWYVLWFIYIFRYGRVVSTVQDCNSISLSHAAIFGWHFSQSLRDRST
jgi:hypothetical protein